LRALRNGKQINEVRQLANTAQARKRVRQNDKRRVHNHSIRATMRTGIKSFLKAVEANDKAGAETRYRAAVSMIDKVAGKGLHHKNRAARLKSRLNNRLRSMA
jgi:small subunit ribosomal protein S20